MSDIETATTGEVQEAVQTPDAGENKKSFDELIEGDYRREYGEKVEAIVKSRLKNHTETKAKLGELTDDERDIILKGCLINYNRV